MNTFHWSTYFVFSALCTWLSYQWGVAWPHWYHGCHRAGQVCQRAWTPGSIRICVAEGSCHLAANLGCRTLPGSGWGNHSQAVSAITCCAWESLSLFPRPSSALLSQPHIWPLYQAKKLFSSLTSKLGHVC